VASGWWVASGWQCLVPPGGMAGTWCLVHGGWMVIGG